MAPTSLRLQHYQLPFKKPFITAGASFYYREGYLALWQVNETPFRSELSPLPSFSFEGLEEAKLQWENTREEFLARYQDPPTYFYTWLHGLKLYSSVEWVWSILYEQYQAYLNKTTFGQASRLAAQPLRVPINAVFGRAGQQELQQQIIDAIAQGYSTLKLKASAEDMPMLMTLIQEVHHQYPKVLFRLDANGQWSAKQCLSFCDHVHQQHLPIQYIEQPLFPCSVSEMALLQRRSAVALAADEMLQKPEDASALVAQKAVKALVIKPLLIGSIQRNIHLIQRAVEANIMVVISTLLDSAINRQLYARLAEYANRLSGMSELAHGLSTGKMLTQDLDEEPIGANGTQYFDHG